MIKVEEFVPSETLHMSQLLPFEHFCLFEWIKSSYDTNHGNLRYCTNNIVQSKLELDDCVCGGARLYIELLECET